MIDSAFLLLPSRLICGSVLKNAVTLARYKTFVSLLARSPGTAPGPRVSRAPAWRPRGRALA